MTVGYVRQSLDKYGDLLGVTRQREDIVALAASLGWSGLTEVYEDNDVSANTAKGKRRPAFERLLADIRIGRVTHVLCYDQDRLVRDMRQLEDVVDAVEAGNASLTSVNGDIDLRTDNGRMVARIKAAVARNEIEKLSRRVSRQARQRAQGGVRANGGQRTFGLTWDNHVVPAEAEVLVGVFRRKAAGDSTASIVAWLNTTGVRTTKGIAGRWTHGQVSAFIRRRIYVGDVTYKGEVVKTAAYEPIVDRTLFEEANGRMPRAQTWRDAPEFGLLTGVLVCEAHGAVMRRGRGPSCERLYNCRGLPSEGKCCHLSAAVADALVLQAVRARLRDGRPDSPARAQPSSPQQSALEHEIDQVERARGRGQMAGAESAAILRYLRERLAVERLHPGPLHQDAGGTGAGSEVWESLSLDEQRAWLGRFVSRVFVARPKRLAGSHSSERVTVHFRDGEALNLARPQVLRSHVAAVAGCTVDTVSRVVNDRPGPSPATQEAVRSAVRELGYSPVGKRRPGARNDRVAAVQVTPADEGSPPGLR